ncbi:MAG: NHL repeat-containing protein, partial [Deltaproteobacteria bacterium]
MKQVRSTGPVRRKLSYVVLLLVIFTFAAKPVLAQETVFGPEGLRIGWFRIHLSFHKFMADESGEGIIIISKNTPEKKIRGGFARLNGEWIPLQSFLRGDTTVFEKRFNFRTRNYLVVLLRGNRGASVNVEVRKKILTPPPEINFSAYPTAIKSGEPSELTWQVSHAETIEIKPDIGMVEASGSLTVSPHETTTYILDAVGKGGTATRGVTLTVYQPPMVIFSADPETVIYGETTTLSWSATNADEIVIDQNIGEVSNESFWEVKPDRTTTYTITASGLGGSAQAQAVVKVKAKVEPQPEGSFGKQYEDLIPPDATIEAYDSKRFSVVTGLVHDVNGLPLADVSVTLHNHAECGTGFTDGEGRFSLPVEGGGTITVVYQKEGLITAHRKVYVPWNDIAVAETIKMIAEDPAATTISFDGNPDTVFTHQSTEVSDESGSRSLTMVFTGDNSAYEVDAQGTVILELSEITTRATEFTTPEAMPAILPPTSAFTYCAELTVDGTQRVKFDKPVIAWVDNFLGFDVGEVVPVGYYDRDKGVWVPSDNGVVVTLLDTDTDGIVDALDSNGDGAPDDLDGDGSFTDEVRGLSDAQKYPAGSTFWRVAVTHFTSWDFNYPPAFPDGATASTATGSIQLGQKKVENLCCPVELGSFVEEKSRIFHEDIAIPGTQLTLHYESDRVPGYGYKITVPASGDTVPASLKRIIVRVKVAGRTLEQTLDPLPNQISELIWNGLDYLGRPVTIPTTADISVGYVYDGVYSIPRNVAASFGQPGIGATTIRSRKELIAWKRDQMVLRRGLVRGSIAEGWTVSLQHQLNPIDPSTLHKGDGGLVRNYAGIISTLGGSGIWGYGGDGGPATEASMKYPSDVTVDASGNVYFADGYNWRVRKIDTNGIITTVAGGGSWGEDIPATEAAMSPTDVACDGSGNLYISDGYSKSSRIWKVDEHGILRRVAGLGPQGYSGDGGPARDALLHGPNGVAVDAEGNIYFGDSGNDRIRKVDTSGIITTVAGTGIAGFSGDGGPAIQARINDPRDVEVDAEGNLYIADNANNRIRKVDTSGIITTVAGGGSPADLLGDGGPATEAALRGPHGVAVDRSGNLYIADDFKGRIRKVDTRGIITTVAGTGISSDPLGDGGPATQARLNQLEGVALDSLGNLYIADTYNYRIRKVSSPLVQVASMEAGDFAFAEE